ncbi:zinc-dependent peptidase [Teredinibacter waterburyi]|jgi:Uncharacterized protein conserved in bacteria|uniref:M90 family metallopeptidase n=1 Tax=Teredinibacter waterburyi TaxID=1500538 RepID=UPI00165F7BE5|nr:M90 family metallopeptidase [Teredinibacter waterburyi]
MTITQTFYTLLASAILAFVAWRYYRKWRYRQAMAQPFPTEWASILKQYLPIYPRLPEALQGELQQHILHFIYTKQFVGCNGLNINDTIRVTIAAEACLLLLNRPTTRYANLKWIYVYPTTFTAKREHQDEYGVVSQKRAHLLGESWQNGRIVLAWDSVEQGMANFTDGHNVVLHEFAHQLDQEDGAANGAPLLYTKDAYRIWAQIFSDEFNQLQSTLARGNSSLIDSYGATNPAEFFAVVTEVFFERPLQMQARHPELFEQLRDYYHLDPSQWLSTKAM